MFYFTLFVVGIYIGIIIGTYTKNSTMEEFTNHIQNYIFVYLTTVIVGSAVVFFMGIR